jgi:hypothetical protein
LIAPAIAGYFRNMQTKCPKCSTSVKSNGSDWEIIGGPCVELAGTHWLLYAEYCPTLSKIAEPDVLLPGATDRVEVEAEIIRLQFPTAPGEPPAP